MESGVRSSIRSAQRADGSQARVTFYGPDGKVTSVFDNARLWGIGGWQMRGLWIDLEEEGLVLHIEYQQGDPLDGSETAI